MLRSRKRVILAFGILLALPLIGCGKQGEPVPVKQDANATAQSMANSPNLSPEQKAKIQEGLRQRNGGASAPGGDQAAPAGSTGK